MQKVAQKEHVGYGIIMLGGVGSFRIQWVYSRVLWPILPHCTYPTLHYRTLYCPTVPYIELAYHTWLYHNLTLTYSVLPYPSMPPLYPTLPHCILHCPSVHPLSVRVRLSLDGLSSNLLETYYKSPQVAWTAYFTYSRVRGCVNEHACGRACTWERMFKRSLIFVRIISLA
jgi:hypothetical protein